MSGQDEPRLVSPRAIRYKKTYMLGRVAGRVQDIHHDVPERETVAVLHPARAIAHTGVVVQDVFGTRLRCQCSPGGSVVGVDMGVENEADTHPRVVSDTK